MSNYTISQTFTIFVLSGDKWQITPWRTTSTNREKAIERFDIPSQWVFKFVRM